MFFHYAYRLKKLGILAALVAMALATISCSSDDGPASPTGDDPVANRAPGAPTIDTDSGAPADAATGVSPNVFLHWHCTDADGDALTFDVHFGTTDTPPAVSTALSHFEFDPPLTYDATYYWQIVATDPDGESTSSAVWSFATAALSEDSIAAPASPTGPATGRVDQELTYTLTPQTTDFGFAAEYRVDFGDGEISSWSSATSYEHTWDTEDTYSVTAQARSAVNHSVESTWSTATQVTIEPEPETLYMGFTMDGPVNIAVGVSGDYEISQLPTSSEGHAVEVRFDWNDGTYSAWSSLKTASHAWDTEGTYQIGIEARCAEHTSITELRSDVRTVEVAAGETITTPTRVSGVSSSNFSSTVYAIRSTATSSFGHALEFEYDFGDGEISDWLPENTSASHTWDLGTYDVRARARCVDHPDIVSAWSEVYECTFRETFWWLGDPTGPTTGLTGEAIQFTCAGAESNEGHTMEYRYFYRRATTTDNIYGEWGLSPDRQITWDSTGTFYVRIQTRCTEHPDVQGTNRDSHTIVISAP